MTEAKHLLAEMAQMAAAIPTLPETLSKLSAPITYEPANPPTNTAAGMAYNSK